MPTPQNLLPQPSYLITRNDDFSEEPKSGSFIQNLENNFTGELNRMKSILADPFGYQKSLQDGRDAEGFVYINGRRLPGIFQGFEVGAGINMEKFDSKTMALDASKAGLKEAAAEAKTNKEVLQTYQVDRGLKPITGRAEFLLLDDEFSTAVAKAKEFVRIVTHWKEGDRAAEQVPRVFKISSLLIGAENSPFNFTSIKIPDYRVTMGTGKEGALTASFTFEQFDIFKQEAKTTAPKSEAKATNSGANKKATKPPATNPSTAPIQVIWPQ